MSEPQSLSNLHREPGGATRLAAVLDAVQRARGARPPAEVPVLEVGCGNGNLAVPIAALGHPVTGIDVDAASLEEARARCPVPAHFEVADPLSFRPAVPPQIIVLSEVLEHVVDPRALLAHLQRIAAPGARLVLTVPNGLGPWELMNFAKRAVTWLGLGQPLRNFQRALGYTGVSLQSKNPHLDHLQFFTKRRLAGLARAAGWRVLSRRNLSMFIAVFPVSMAFRKWPGLEPIDTALARTLPAEAASGWLLELESALSNGTGGPRSGGSE